MQGKEDWLVCWLQFGLLRKLWNIKHQNFFLQPRWTNKDQIYSPTKTTQKWTKYTKHVVDIRHQATKGRHPWGTRTSLERAPGPGEGGRPRDCESAVWDKAGHLRQMAAEERADQRRRETWTPGALIRLSPPRGPLGLGRSHPKTPGTSQCMGAMPHFTQSGRIQRTPSNIPRRALC